LGVKRGVTEIRDVAADLKFVKSMSRKIKKNRVIFSSPVEYSPLPFFFFDVKNAKNAVKQARK